MTATRILGAYVDGFRTVFLLNAGLNAVATVAAIFLIRHTDLTRADEAALKHQAEVEARKAEEKAKVAEDSAGEKEKKAGDMV